jgi:hypothetical protein
LYLTDIELIICQKPALKPHDISAVTQLAGKFASVFEVNETTKGITINASAQLGYAPEFEILVVSIIT